MNCRRSGLRKKETKDEAHARKLRDAIKAWRSLRLLTRTGPTIRLVV